MVAITTQTMNDEIRRQQKLSGSITDLQQSISSSQKLTRASQDPQAWVQVSEIGRTQQQQAAWKTNITFATTRATKAEANLTDINALYSRARELLVSSSSATMDAASKSAVAAELRGIRTSISELLAEKDFQGTPVFDNTQSVLVPVARGLNVEATATVQAVSQGVDLGGGTTGTLDSILSDAIAAVESSNGTAIGSALTAVEKGLDHIILNQSMQGIRSDRIAKIAENHQDTDIALSERRSGLEDTNLTEAIATLNSKLLTLQAAQAAFARINRQSLFDLLG